jgi:hypothetical protein
MPLQRREDNLPVHPGAGGKVQLSFHVDLRVASGWDWVTSYDIKDKAGNPLHCTLVLLSMTPRSIDQAERSPAGLLSLRGRSRRASQTLAWRGRGRANSFVEDRKKGNAYAVVAPALKIALNQDLG